MNYVCVSVGYFTHRKTRLLVEISGCEIAALVPIKFWSYAALNQPDGDFSQYSDKLLEEIAGLENAHWNRRVIEAMRTIGFFGPGMILHNWERWNGFHGRRSEAARTAAKARWQKAPEPEPAQAAQAQNNGHTLTPDRPPVESDPPPDIKHKGGPALTGPPCVSGSQPPTKGAEPAPRSTPSFSAVKRKKTASLSAQAFSLRRVCEDHPGNPRNRTSETTAEQKADYKTKAAHLAELDCQIAGVDPVPSPRPPASGARSVSSERLAPAPLPSGPTDAQRIVDLEKLLSNHPGAKLGAERFSQSEFRALRKTLEQLQNQRVKNAQSKPTPDHVERLQPVR